MLLLPVLSPAKSLPTAAFLLVTPTGIEPVFQP